MYDCPVNFKFLYTPIFIDGDNREDWFSVKSFDTLKEAQEYADNNFPEFRYIIFISEV